MPSELTEILSKLGVEVVRQRGSHQQFRDANSRCTTVSAHKGRYIAPPLLRQEVLYAIGLISQSLLRQLVMSYQLSRQP
jgi:predicted RNA binding protein YcfA (HicA-like mRNA interferase family)